MSRPELSVLLPVYNGASYLREAIESILGQTYTDFELIIIDDGSTDDSLTILEEFVDSRIRVFSQTNRGLAASLNRAIGLAQGRYVARQDQDDLSLPQRLEKQIHFLDEHPPAGMVGTWARILAGSAETGRVHRHPSDNATLKFALMFDNPFVHSSMMIRKSVFDSVGVYTTDPSRQPPEDYELWSRVARVYDVANIPEVLHIYREVPKSMSRDGANPFLDRLVNISAENIARVLGREAHDETLIDLSALAHGAYHRVSEEPSLSRMQEDVNEMARRLAETCDVQDDQLMRMAQKTFQILKASDFRRRHRVAEFLLDRARRLIGAVSTYVRS